MEKLQGKSRHGRRGPIPGLDGRGERGAGLQGYKAEGHKGRRPPHLISRGKAALVLLGLAAGAFALGSAGLPGQSRAFFGGGGFSGIVFDPTNHATNLEKLARGIQQVAQTAVLVANSYQQLQTMGPVGALLGIASIPGLDGAFPISLDAEDARMVAAMTDIAKSANTIYSAKNSVYRNSQLKRRSADLSAQQIGEIAAVYAARGTGQSALYSDIRTITRIGAEMAGGNPYSYYTLPATMTDVLTYLGAQGQVDSTRAHLISMNRRSEYGRSSTDSVAVGLHAMQLSAEADRRTAALSEAAAQAGNEREQLAILTQSQIALIETMEGVRLLLGQLVRQEGLRDLATLDPLGRVPELVQTPAAAGNPAPAGTPSGFIPQ